MKQTAGNRRLFGACRDGALEAEGSAVRPPSGINTGPVRRQQMAAKSSGTASLRHETPRSAREKQVIYPPFQPPKETLSCATSSAG
ncbi:hypothetical protein HMPREF9080_00198 [Cardiobacterium valvarum F0432]|uniref:Uncharacterized protein n=1 Tax=Cardiobacterium valvarum F0432 TaxID=797473 RepID=G9ZBS1_9GAMM|nr:hypothetical protein HMPREF9080_00198 [Cardiobacterium valvarum F0432]